MDDDFSSNINYLPYKYKTVKTESNTLHASIMKNQHNHMPSTRLVGGNKQSMKNVPISDRLTIFPIPPAIFVPFT